MGTTEFIFWLFLFFIIWKKDEVRDPGGLRREENRKLPSRRLLGHGTTVVLGPFKFRFLHFKKFLRACMIVQLDWKSEEEARSWWCVQENFHNQRPWHLNRMRKARARRGEGQRTSGRLNGAGPGGWRIWCRGDYREWTGMSRLELSTRYLRSLLVVYLGRDKDQRLTKAVFSVSSTRNWNHQELRGIFLESSSGLWAKNLWNTRRRGRDGDRQCCRFKTGTF